MDDLVEERVGAGDGKVGEIAVAPAAAFVDILRSEACCVYFVFVVVVVVVDEEEVYPLLVLLFVASLLNLALFDLAFKSCNETVDVDLLCVLLAAVVVVVEMVALLLCPLSCLEVLLFDKDELRLDVDFFCFLAASFSGELDLPLVIVLLLLQTLIGCWIRDRDQTRMSEDGNRER